MAARHIVMRLANAVLVLVGVSLLVFGITRTTGDPAALLLGNEATEEQLEKFREDYGLNLPLPVQYFRFAGNALKGDFGESLRYREPALPLVLERLPATAQLAAAAFLWSIATAVPLGIIAAVRRKSGWAHLSVFVALIGQSVPSFWLAIMLILVFPVGLGWFYTSGYGTPGHLVLPAAALGLFQAARMTRLVRAGMLDVLAHDYIRTARAKGLRERTVLYRHALRNAMLPILTVLGLDIAALLGGAAVTETIFAWPGMGLLAIQAVANRDYPIVLAVVFVITTVYVVINLATDIAYTYLDPRVKYG